MINKNEKLGEKWLRKNKSFYLIIHSMRLHHSPEDSTYPRFKQMCFVYIMFFRKSNKMNWLLPGYVHPSRVVLKYDSFS